MRLPKKVKAKWLKALRSGEYKQERGTLHNPKTGGFCCLGVLECEMLDGEVEYDKDDEMFYTGPTLDFWNYIGAEVEMNELYPTEESDPDISKLMRQNDGKEDLLTGKVTGRKKFTTIANWIEKNIEVLD